MTIGHVALQVVPGDDLMMHRGAREVTVVAAHAHQLVGVLHLGGWVRDDDGFTAQEERVGLLRLGAHHLDAPQLFGELGDGQEVALLQEAGRLMGQLDDQLGLLAGLYMQVFHGIHRRFPVIAETDLTRGGEHLRITPSELALRDGDQLLGCIGDALVSQMRQQGLTADRVAHHRLVLPWSMTNDTFAQVTRVIPHRAEGRLRGPRAPPRHLRMITLIEGHPLTQVLLQALQLAHHAQGQVLRRLRLSSLLDSSQGSTRLLGQLCQALGTQTCIRLRSLPAGIMQMAHNRRVRDPRLHLRHAGLQPCQL